MLNVVRLSVNMLSVIMLNVNILSAIMVSVIMPQYHYSECRYADTHYT
jgi:hypothetical protein